jgi:hypothetical protein
MRKILMSHNTLTGGIMLTFHHLSEPRPDPQGGARERKMDMVNTSHRATLMVSIYVAVPGQGCHTLRIFVCVARSDYARGIDTGEAVQERTEARWHESGEEREREWYMGFPNGPVCMDENMI